jgi:TolB-like protein
MNVRPEDWSRVKALFHAALEIEPAARPAYLAAACGDEPAIRAQVEALLASHDRAGAMLETPAAAVLEITDGAADLAGRRIGPYHIEALIGRGGMGEVYKAHDTKLDRPVAIKLLPRHLAADADRLRRFHAEVRAASSLNHPHILVVHDVDTLDGRPIMVTELVEGTTLRQTLSNGALAVRDALDIAIQATSALAAAHARGIVHRDVKPENIMIRHDGYVKVLDFGLVKLTAADRAATTLETAAGRVMGTPRYMSPEQVRGSAVDARADVWSLGVVLYEMLAGRPPFDGPTSSDVVAAILTTEPAPIDRAAAPAALGAIVMTALAKNADARYASAEALHRELVSMRANLTGAGFPAARTPAASKYRLAAIGVALALMAGGGVFLATRGDRVSDEGSKPAASAGAPEGRAEITRLVVLPFENLTGSSGDDWLAGGMADSLTHGLRNVGSVALLSRERISEIYRELGVKDSAALDPRVVRAVADRLNAQAFVHGTYQLVGGQIRVVARLVSADSGQIRAQESVTDKFDNVLQLEDQLAQRFASALSDQIAPFARASGTSSLEAYRAFSEARTRYAAGELREAAARLEHALAIDPNYAQAWALSSKIRTRVESPTVETGRRPTAAQESVVAAARRAAQLDPSLYDAQTALALAYRFAQRIPEAREAARRAISLNPREAEGYSVLADTYSMTPSAGCGRDRDFALADANYRAAMRLDPVFAFDNRSTNLMWANRMEEALAAIDEGIAAVPQSQTMRFRRILLLAGLNRPVDAQTRASLTNPTIGNIYAGALADLRNGHEAIARAGFEQADALLANLEAPDIEIYAGYTYFVAGLPDRAIAHLDRAVRIDSHCGRYIASVPLLSRFEHYSQFRTFVGKHRSGIS